MIEKGDTVCNKDKALGEAARIAAREIVANWNAIKGENGSHAVENVTAIIRSTLNAAALDRAAESREGENDV